MTNPFPISMGGGNIPNTADDEQLLTGPMRIACRLARLHADDLMYIVGVGWHYYDGHRWQLDVDSIMATAAVTDTVKDALIVAVDLKDVELRKDAVKCTMSSGITTCLKVAAAKMKCNVADLDADPYLLNLKNGTLDLRTMELRDHNPADRITKMCNASWQPDAKGQMWERFLATSLPSVPVREYLQRLCGSALLGEVREHVLSIWTGEGGNGKGVLQGMLETVLGDYYWAAEPDLMMARDNAHTTGMMDLQGRRLVTMSESDKGRRMGEATMKRLTGGDKITARRMHKDNVSFNPSHTAILITNHLPELDGEDGAIKRRVSVIPFDVVIPEEERIADLPALLKAEMEAVLAWLIDGWMEYQRRGGLFPPPEVLTRTDRYMEESESGFKLFLETECIIRPGMDHIRATTGELWGCWEEFRDRECLPEMSRKEFQNKVTKAGFPVNARDGKNRYRTGIRLRKLGDPFDSN